jgi:hypothetical protein
VAFKTSSEISNRWFFKVVKVRKTLLEIEGWSEGVYCIKQTIVAHGLSAFGFSLWCSKLFNDFKNLFYFQWLEIYPLIPAFKQRSLSASIT